MIQCAIFDFDNTLYDYDICNNSALDSVYNFLFHNYCISFEECKNVYSQINSNIKFANNYANKFNKHIYFKQLVEHFSLPLHTIQELVNLYDASFYAKLAVHDYVIQVLQLLRKNNVKICILSNNNFRQQYNKLKELQLLEFIDCIQTSDEVGYEKPSKTIFLALFEKLSLDPKHCIFVGDNFSHDIQPSKELGMLSFLLTNTVNAMTLQNSQFFAFSHFKQIYEFLDNFLKAEQKLIFLSKLFGQSVINVQGQGGNISVKTHDLLLIKSSGSILGNIDSTSGFCIANNSMCNHLLQMREPSKLNETKLFGHKVPSMESFFHGFMKRICVHLHFTLSNLLFCTTNGEKVLKDNAFPVPYKVIEYSVPGLDLALLIKEVYDTNVPIYFLKNHGVIIHGETCDEVINYYFNLLNFFGPEHDCYEGEKNASLITMISQKKWPEKLIVCREYICDMGVEIFSPIQYCFPDLAVYCQTVLSINNLSDISFLPDLILYQGKIYIVAANLTKLYSIKETLDAYVFICKQRKGTISLIQENDINGMAQEKFRKNS
jgi:putative hydrolase of the HAD superfamily